METSHKRALTFGFNIIERDLERIINDLEDAGDQPRFQGEIDSDDKAKILNAAKLMLKEIEIIRKKYGLEGRQESVRLKRRLHGRLIEIYNILYDLRPKSLEPYGKITESDKEELGREIEKLAKSLESMYEAIK